MTQIEGISCVTTRSCIQRRINNWMVKETCALKERGKRTKFSLHKKNVLENFLVKLQRNISDVIKWHHHITSKSHHITASLHHAFCFKIAWNWKNVLENVLHLKEFTFWAFLLSKQQRTAHALSRNVPITCFMKWPPSLSASINRGTFQWKLQEFLHK